MVRVLIFTIGPRGDIAPCIALVKAMRDQGSVEHIAVAGHASSRKTIEGTGALFYDIGPERPEALARTEEGQALREEGAKTMNPMKRQQLKKQFLAPLVRK